jgi:hypothetical protein
LLAAAAVAKVVGVLAVTDRLYLANLPVAVQVPNQVRF